MIRPTHPDGTPLTIREQLERAAGKKSKRAAKALTLWPPAVQNGPRRPRRVLTPRQRLRTRLDGLWSLVVRKRDTRMTGGLCRICGVRQIEVGYHLLPRQHDSTRWNLENGVGACCACNRGEQMNRLTYREKHIVLFGAAKMAYLEREARTIAKFSMADLERIYEDLKKELQK